MRHLLCRTEVRDERSGDTEAVGDDAADVDGGVAHALDGGDDVQHTGDLLRAALDRPASTHTSSISWTSSLRRSAIADFVGHALVREEQGGVAEVDHQLEVSFASESISLRFRGGEISRSVVHHVSLKTTSDRISDTAPSRSDADETSGIP